MSDDIMGFADKSTQELQDMLCSLRHQKQECYDKIAKINQALAERAATFRRGDRVGSNVASGEWEITDIRAVWDSRPTYFGKKIKKDGTPGSREVEIFSPYRKQTDLVEASNER